MRKKLKGGPFGIFQHPFCRKTPKNSKFFEKNLHNAEKKLKGGPFSIVRYCMLCGIKETPFRFSFLGQQVQFGGIFKFYRTFGRTILVTSDVSKKNTDEKP